MHSPQCQTFRPFRTLFSPSASEALSQQLPQGSGTSLVVFHQSHQYFNILFSRCLSRMYFLLLPALHLGLMGKSFLFFKVQFSSAAQSCPTLCHPMNRSTPGLLVHHQLPEFTQTHVHRVRDAIQPSHPGSSPSPPAPNPSQHQSRFQ